MTALTERFLQELHETHDAEDAVFLVDHTPHRKTPPKQLGLRPQTIRHAIEHILRKTKQRTSSLSNSTRHVNPTTPES